MKHVWCRPQRRTKTSSRRIDNKEALSEWLESLQIMNKTSDETIERLDKVMSVALAQVTENINRQIVMPKSIVPDPG